MIAVSSFLQGRDVFVTLPTGFGKSLCYAVLPKVFDTLSTDRSSISGELQVELEESEESEK